MTSLTRELIEHPELWRLSMLVSEANLDVVLYTPLQEQALMYRRLPLNAAAASPVTALQEAVYDNPLLLSDFERVDILIDTKRFMLVPEELADTDTATQAMKTLWDSPDISDMECDKMGKVRSQRLLMAVDSHLLTFLRRTFPTARIDHPLSSLIAYFGSKAAMGANSKLYVLLKAAGIYIVAFRRGVPQVVNAIDVTGVDDIVYYILATAKMSGMSLTSDEVMLGGDAMRRDAVAKRLREFVKYVMPVIFPAEIYRSGKEALQAPFELVILPLCV